MVESVVRPSFSIGDCTLRETPCVLRFNRLAEQLALALEHLNRPQDPLLNLSAIGLLIEKSQLLLGTPLPSPAVSPSTRLLRVGPLQIDLRSRDVTIAGERINLSRREHELLTFLARHHDTALARGRILLEVWGEAHMGKENLLDVYIGYVRAKLKAHGAHGMLETLRGTGYILRSPLEGGGDRLRLSETMHLLHS